MVLALIKPGEDVQVRYWYLETPIVDSIYA
jgi:hypothetical protein